MNKESLIKIKQICSLQRTPVPITLLVQLFSWEWCAFCTVTLTEKGWESCIMSPLCFLQVQVSSKSLPLSLPSSCPGCAALILTAVFLVRSVLRGALCEMHNTGSAALHRPTQNMNNSPTPWLNCQCWIIAVSKLWGFLDKLYMISVDILKLCQWQMSHLGKKKKRMKAVWEFLS